jgi:hypothetical protein
MLKYTDVYTMIQQKISRNKSIIAIHELKIEQVNMVVDMQEKIKNHYQNTIAVCKEINEIELLQTVEYTVEHEKKITDLHMSVYSDQIQEEIDGTYRNDMQRIKDLIEYHLEVVKYLSNKIPKSGIATNYTIHTIDPTQTCHAAV